LHLIDATADDPIGDYQTIQAELQAYGRGLSERPQILALNKIDAVDSEMVELLATELNHLTHVPVFQISAVTHRGLESLLQTVWQSLEQLEDVEVETVTKV
jgi:GTP-binding protein